MVIGLNPKINLIQVSGLYKPGTSVTVCIWKRKKELSTSVKKLCFVSVALKSIREIYLCQGFLILWDGLV